METLPSTLRRTFVTTFLLAVTTDWYLPARDELELIYRNLKPFTNNNFTGLRPNSPTANYTNLGSIGTGGTGQGLNYNSDPQGVAYTTGSPAQTSVAAFQTGGAEAMLAGPNYYWSSTQYGTGDGWIHYYDLGTPGQQNLDNKTGSQTVRAVRRSII
jgi:hypothetical protein